ncbi:MAG: transposase [Planctomycetota bacterium]
MSSDGLPKLPKIPELSDLPPDQVTPVVLTLLEICHHQQEQIQQLRDEIARLKGEKPRPKLRPSTLETEPPRGKKGDRAKKRCTRRKTHELRIHETVYILPGAVPAGSRFKGYEDFTVQDIRLELHNTRFRLARWETPSGERLVGTLPPELGGGHYGPTLVSYILHQYHHAHVTQPLLLEQLREWGVDISAGQVSAIITQGKERFHAEKEELLRVGLAQSEYVHVDDTGARHQGKNGVCTHIGNELFAYFASTDSKSRINFLELLRAGHDDYVLNDEALAHMREQHLPKGPLALLAGHAQKTWSGKQEWQATLEGLGVTDLRHVRIATEGALLGSVLEHGVNRDLVIMSDDAGQFDVLLHALCWIHAERVFVKLVGFNDAQREALAAVRTEIWEVYAELKAYKTAPDQEKKAQIDARFDTLCATQTCFVSLNLALQRMHRNKAELLLVLQRPGIPLHNNLSEGDIREYVKKRKISGSTRSDEGRRCRDTFASLKKTCRKLGISFWAYLNDRVRGASQTPPLAEWIRSRASPRLLAVTTSPLPSP